MLCVQRPLALAPFLILLAGCGDGGGGPDDDPLVPRIQRITPRADSPEGEAALYLDLEVRTRTGTPYPDAFVTWDLSHGAMLASPPTDERGELQAQWTFTLADEPSGTSVQARACARRQFQDPCAWTEPATATIP
jgi:hypothetical protein